MADDIFQERLYNGTVTAAEIEAYAAGLADMLLLLGVWCGHGKSYDPLSIRDEGYAASYIFDLWDGGRGHEFESLQQLAAGLRADAASWTKRCDVPVEEKVFRAYMARAEELNATPLREKELRDGV